MISFSEFFLGEASSAPVGSFILPQSSRHGPCIVGSKDEHPYLVYLSQDAHFSSYPLAGGYQSTKGIIIPNVSIELDEGSFGSYDSWETRAGSIIVENGRISVLAGDRNTSGMGRFQVKLADTPSADFAASFSKWQIVIGSGADKRCLFSVDSTASV